jgi:beta-lactamase regulating signal transducer with metallopeptidase domain
MNASTDFMLPLAWSLLHFLWQGALLAMLAGALMLAFRKPAARYLIGVGAMALMFLSFGVTFTLLSSTSAETELLATRAPAAALVSPLETPVGFHLRSVEQQAAMDSQREFLWLAQGWMAGVFVLALRLAFGLLVIEYLRRRNLIALPETLVARFRALQDRLGIRRMIRYRESSLVDAPAVLGFFRPIVLIPMRALTGLSPEQLEAVIAHELGHIKRFDVAVNFFQVIAETLFFFHPAVWWLNRRIRADREDCCDDIAVNAAGERLGYARALATMAGWRATPRLAMAATGGPLSARVARLLGAREHTRGRTAGVVAIALFLAASVAASAISFGIAGPAVAQTTPESPPAPASPPSPPAPVSPPSSASRVSQSVKPAPAPKPAPAAAPTPAVKPVPAPKASPPGASYLEQMKSSGVDFDVNQLIALRSQDVTPEYVRAMRGTGLEFDVHALVALKSQDVTPEYVAQVRAQGFSPSVHEIIALKAQDVSPDYVNEMRALGIDMKVGELIALKAQGVTPEYVREMRAAGFDPRTHEIIAMKVHDITPEYRRQFEAAGFKLDVGELIQARAMDVTPEFIAKVRSHGFKNLSFHQLIQLKNADVL